MNLQNLFEIQAGLDFHIRKEKGLEEKDLLDKKILALQVELGELANEWRGFKFWSENRKQRILESSCSDDKAEYFECGTCLEHFTVEKAKAFNYECPDDENALLGFKRRNTVLEEYVDCLHFILSIGNDLDVDIKKHYGTYQGPDITRHFNFMFQDVSNLSKCIFAQADRSVILEMYYEVCRGFIGLGELLGFTQEQIEQAYLDKNKINHERQVNGY